MYSHATSWSASRRSVQRWWPIGGALQAKATRWASHCIDQVAQVATGFVPLQGGLQALLDKALAYACNRRETDIKRLTDGFVAPGRATAASHRL